MIDQVMRNEELEAEGVMPGQLPDENMVEVQFGNFVEETAAFQQNDGPRAEAPLIEENDHRHDDIPDNDSTESDDEDEDVAVSTPLIDRQRF
jgi:hypothetical protein